MVTIETSLADVAEIADYFSVIVGFLDGNHVRFLWIYCAQDEKNSRNNYWVSVRVCVRD